MRNANMKEHNNENNLSQFLKFLTIDEPRFRKAVLYLPLVAAICGFVLNWLVLDKTFSESLFVSAFIFLLICFIGLIYEAIKRRNLS